MPPTRPPAISEVGRRRRGRGDSRHDPEPYRLGDNGIRTSRSDHPRGRDDIWGCADMGRDGGSRGGPAASDFLGAQHPAQLSRSVRFGQCARPDLRCRVAWRAGIATTLSSVRDAAAKAPRSIPTTVERSWSRATTWTESPKQPLRLGDLGDRQSQSRLPQHQLERPNNDSVTVDGAGSLDELLPCAADLGSGGAGSPGRGRWRS
jgi:hypothetical protein